MFVEAPGGDLDSHQLAMEADSIPEEKYASDHPLHMNKQMETRRRLVQFNRIQSDPIL